MTLALSLFVLFYILMLAVQQYRPWVALGGAGAFLLLGKLGVYDFTLADAARAVDFNVLLMMAGMMGTVFLFIQSKMPARLAEELIAHVPDVRWAVSVLALLAGFISAFVDNVATVLMVAPVGLAIARRLKRSPVPVLIAIAVSYLKLSEMHPFHTFRPHPFKVRDDAKMQETVASIKANGVMVPGLARPEKDGNGYEIVAGHRRHHGCELAGLEEMPFIVREMTDHEAVQAMKDSNKQRDQTLPSELAALLELEVEDIKHQGGRLKNVAEGDIGKRSVEIVGEAHDMNYKKVMRYLRLNSLVPELLDKVDDKKMGFMPAVEISYIRPKNQRLIAVSIDGEQASPSLAQAKKLRELDKDGKLNGDVIDGILSEKKKEDRGVIISTAELEKYFGKEATPAKMKEQIMTLLDEWKEKQPPELAKAPKKMEQDK